MEVKEYEEKDKTNRLVKKREMIGECYIFIFLCLCVFFLRCFWFLRHEERKDEERN